MSSLRIAVTGGSGSVGSVVIKELVACGHQVVNLDRRAPQESLCRFVYLDLAAREQVQPVLEQVDAVIHLGEISSHYHPLSPEMIYAHNTRVGSVVLQTAADLKLRRVIYTSSCQVYGCWDNPTVPPDSLPMDETHPLRPQNVYALSKFANEHYARLLSARSGLSIAIFRLPTTVTWPMSDAGWVRYRRRGGEDDGMGTYVGGADAARAYRLAVENPRPGCEAYHFSAANVLLFSPLQEWLMKRGFPALPSGWPGNKSPLVTEKARAHFSWQPEFDAMQDYERRVAAGTIKA